MNPARRALAECAELDRNWAVLHYALDQLEVAEPRFDRPAWMAEAYLGLRQDQKAEKRLDEVAKSHPALGRGKVDQLRKFVQLRP